MDVVPQKTFQTMHATLEDPEISIMRSFSWRWSISISFAYSEWKLYINPTSDCDYQPNPAPVRGPSACGPAEGPQLLRDLHPANKRDENRHKLWSWNQHHYLKLIDDNLEMFINHHQSSFYYTSIRHICCMIMQHGNPLQKVISLEIPVRWLPRHSNTAV